MIVRVRFRSEAAEGTAGGAEVGDGGGRHVAFLELLRDDADGGAEVLVILGGGVAEARED